MVEIYLRKATYFLTEEWENTYIIYLYTQITFIKSLQFCKDL